MALPAPKTQDAAGRCSGPANGCPGALHRFTTAAVGAVGINTGLAAAPPPPPRPCAVRGRADRRPPRGPSPSAALRRLSRAVLIRLAAGVWPGNRCPAPSHALLNTTLPRHIPLGKPPRPANRRRSTTNCRQVLAKLCRLNTNCRRAIEVATRSRATQTCAAAGQAVGRRPQCAAQGLAVGLWATHACRPR